MRKSTLVTSGLLVMLAALSQADAQTSGSTDPTWTTGMQQYVQNEFKDAHSGSDAGFWQWFCGYFPGACPGQPGSPGPSDVAEPGTLLLIAGGLALMGLSVHRRRARHARK